MSVSQNKPLRAVLWASVSSLPQAAQDKISLEDQQRLCREWCEANGCVIVDRLVVPGYSRYESDPILLMEDYANQGIWAYHRIREHWQRKDFEVLVCYHDSRFARSATVYSWVGENVIRSGARIYRINGGWIDGNNSPFQLALGQIAATTGVQQLIAGRKAGMKSRAQRGLPTSSGVAMSHKVIRDEYGQAVKQIVDESKRRLFNDLATLILEGVGWREMEKELYCRFGHANERNRPYQVNRMYTMITNPTFWGHSAQHYRLKSKYGKFASIGEWIYEPGHEIPPGVTIYYNTHEPVWTSEVADAVKAELRRRSQLLGRAWPYNTHPFTGLLVCGECGYVLVANNGKYSNGYRCMSHYNQSETRSDCSQNNWIHEKYIRAWLNARLKEMSGYTDWSKFLDETSQPESSDRLELLDQEMAQLEGEIKHMIVQQAKRTTQGLHDLYEEQITQAGERLEILKTQRDQAYYRSTQQAQEDQARRLVYEEIEGAIDEFWTQSSREINQLLHRLLGSKRLCVLNGQIVGVVKASRRHRQRA